MSESVEKPNWAVTGKNMTFRISFKTLILVLFCSLTWGLQAYTQESQKPSWVDQYQTPEFEFPQAGSKWQNATAGRHPDWVHTLLNKWVAWDPRDHLSRLTPNCSAADLQSLLQRTQTDQQFNSIYQKYSERCGSESIKSFGPPYLGVLGMFAMKYNLDENPFLRRTVIYLPNGQKIKAALALKDEKPRPFVILRMGITGNVEESFAERFFYYHMFERGFFHLLIVENMTSTDFISNNKTTDLGGIAEGYQNIWLAQYLRNPAQKISRLIESLHFVGLSLGGQGVLTAAWLQPAQRNPNLIQSFLGLCPLINLKPTFDQLFNQGYLKYPLEFWARSRFQEAKKFRPEIYSGFFGLPQKVLEVNQKNFKKESAFFKVQEPAFIKNSDDYLFLHQLASWDPSLRNPVSIWVTSKDDIVDSKLNAFQLPQTFPLLIPQGQHCSFPVEWHPHVTQALFNAHILKNSKFVLRYPHQEISSQQQSDWQFSSVVESNKELIVQIKSKKSNQQIELPVLKQQIDFKFEKYPLGPYELGALDRWFSTNLRIHYQKQGTSMTVTWPFVRIE